MMDRRLWAVLACPSCSKPLDQAQAEAVCTGCGLRYPVGDGQVDLHLRGPKHVDLPITIRPFGDPDPRYLVRPSPIPMNPDAVIDRDAYEYDDQLWFGNGLTRELTSWLPGGTTDEVLLDLGCGARRAEPVMRLTGMSYLGLDVAGAEPDVLGSAEALPIADESIDTVFTLAVLPHVPRPWLAATEIARVLKPGGVFVGTAQFLEPCDMQSRHHVTALGVLDWLQEGGFEVVGLEANERWSGVRAISMMGYYPRRRRVARAVAVVLEQGHALYRKVQPATGAPLGEGDVERYTGGFRFVARRAA
jgi:SAM-dependent methyltransferase